MFKNREFLQHLENNVEFIIILSFCAISSILVLISYLLFYVLVEFYTVIIASSLFIIGWNSRKFTSTTFFSLVGVGFLFIGLIDLLCLIFYPGMNIYMRDNANVAAQLWIVARYMQAFTLLIATATVTRTIGYKHLLPIYSIITTIFLISITLGFFPVCYIENSGVTLFYLISEYIIIVAFGGSVLMLIHYKEGYNQKVFNYLLYSLTISILSEFFFTIHGDIYGVFNVLGHLVKVVAFFFVYKALVETGLQSPWSTLFKKLKENEEILADKARKLEDSEKKFRLTFENAADAIIWVDFLDGMIINCNKAAEELFERKKKELIGSHQSTLHPTSKDINCISSYKNALNEGEVYNNETQIITKSGKVIPIQVVASLMDIGNRKIIQSFFRNMSVQKNMEDALKKSEERYKVLVENAQEGIWAIDKNADTTYVNKRLAEILGYEPEEMLGKSVFFFMEEHEQELCKMHLKRREQGVKEQYDFKFLKKNGQDVYTSLEAAPLMNENGDYMGGFACVADITDRVEAEEKIRNLSKFPSEDPNPVLRVDKMQIIYSNKVGENLFEIKIGDPIPILLLDPINDVVEKNQLRKFEIKLKEHHYSLIITPVKSANYVNIYGMDITDRVKAEQNLKNLITILSHELRTPITVLSLSLEHLQNHKEYLTPEVEVRLMDGMVRNVGLLHKLADDLINIFILDEGRVKLVMKEYRPLDIFQEIFTLMHPFCEKKGIICQLKVDHDIILRGDPMRIDQIFRIIIDNAIKYSNKGNKVSIESIKDYEGKYNSKNKHGVLFKFQDEGIGISSTELPLIFERFYRSKEVQEIPGTGLGLSIAKELIELHEGEIHVESIHGKGTTFYVFLPRL